MENFLRILITPEYILSKLEEEYQQKKVSFINTYITEDECVEIIVMICDKNDESVETC